MLKVLGSENFVFSAVNISFNKNSYINLEEVSRNGLS